MRFPTSPRPKVRDWWGGLLKGQLDEGVAGYLTDMNEPTVVRQRRAHRRARSRWMRCTRPTSARVPHAEIHNVYGMLETMATREGMLRARPNERPFIITRSTYAGGQRYAAQWSGDNCGTWDHLRLSMPMLNGMGLSGLQFAGADIGGIMPVPSPELYTRWMQTGVLTPFAWTHSRARATWSPGRSATAWRRSIASPSSCVTACCLTSTPPSGRRRRPASPSCARCCWSIPTTGSPSAPTMNTCSATICWSRPS